MVDESVTFGVGDWIEFGTAVGKEHVRLNTTEGRNHRKGSRRVLIIFNFVIRW